MKSPKTPRMKLPFPWPVDRLGLGVRADTRRAAATLWHRHLGRPALLGLALLVAVAWVQWQWRPSLLREQLRLEGRQIALASQASSGRDITLSAIEPLPYQALPVAKQRGRDLEGIVRAAQAAGLTLDRADYALGAASSDAVLRVQASLPLAGSYDGLRRFVAAVLNDLPHSALESLQIERPNTQSLQIQATAKLVLFYRKDAP